MGPKLGCILRNSVRGFRQRGEFSKADARTGDQSLSMRGKVFEGNGLPKYQCSWFYDLQRMAMVHCSITWLSIHPNDVKLQWM